MRKLTQSQLADQLGISKSAVANYESDLSHPKEEILIKMFGVLGVDANYLFQDAFLVDENGDLDFEMPSRAVFEPIGGVYLDSKEYNCTIAAHRPDGYDEDLPEEAKKELESFIEYLKVKYKK
jgi:transcriptional regulator with XRE-family HTH domain